MSSLEAAHLTRTTVHSAAWLTLLDTLPKQPLKCTQTPPADDEQIRLLLGHSGEKLCYRVAVSHDRPH